MDEHLLAAYRGTDYRVRLPGGTTACLHVDEALPVALHALVADAAWGLITAWHPGSRPAPLRANRAAQRQLLARLREEPATARILPAAGAGVDGWREPSLFVIGPSLATFQCLATAFGQRAFLAGEGADPARLHWAPPPVA